LYFMIAQNHLFNLQEKIQARTANVAVIGLGYVGLPVACSFAEAGFDVTGVDIQLARIAQINAGISPIDGKEPGLEEMLQRAVEAGKLRATNDYQALADRDVILIDVETPVDGNHVPRYEALRAALHGLGPVLKPGALVVVESTIAPSTMQSVVRPILERTSRKKLNHGFYLGNCPERVMPGKLLANLRSLSRVVGGATPETAETMILLYRCIVQGELDPADWITAELVKTVENAYRDVQIAFANEVALICETLGGDVWKVRELVNKSPHREMHLPGAGVGGHCITKDPWLLINGIQGKDAPVRLIPAARAVNDGMPLHVAGLLEQALAGAGRETGESKVLVMGYAYLEDSDDTRNSPSETLARRLAELEVETAIHDPFVEEFKGDLLAKAEGCDAVMVMVKHSEYRGLDLGELCRRLRTPILIDGRHLFDAEAARSAGLGYWGVGIGPGK
jgi:UDP-N-acetyl-D-mannosaminuronic acid dehydrogenase